MTTSPLDSPGPRDPLPPRSRTPRALRRVLSGVCLVLLLISVVGNVLLMGEAKRDYRKVCEAHLDPYGLKHPGFPPDAPAGPELTTAGRGSANLPVVVFFGDSRAQGWAPPAVAGHRFMNRGVYDQTTEQVRGRFDAHVAPLSPRVVVLQAGINDLKAIPLLPHRREEIISDCKANLREVVRRSRDGGAVVIVSTIFPPGKVTLGRRMVWSPDIERAVEEVNADVRGWAAEGVIVLDAWQLLEDHGQLRDDFGVDTLHLSARGYEVLNAELAKALKTLGTPTPSPDVSNGFASR